MSTATENVQTESRLDRVREQAKEKFEELKHKAQEGYEKASVKAHQTWDKVSDTSLNDVQGAVTNYVKENPGKSVMMAAGAGLIIGLILGARRR